jgi:hypothetical protein
MVTSAVAQTTAANSWRSSLTLYGWLPSVEGKLNYDLGGNDSGSIDAEDILDALDFAFMGAFEIRNGQWSLVSDVIYLKFSNDNTTSVSLPSGTLSAAVDQELDGWQIGIYAGYNVYSVDQSTIDVVLGLRYLTIDADASLSIDGPLPSELPGRELSSSDDLWDGIIGVRGRVGFATNWFIPYHFDIGAGDSDLTWQVLAGVGYEAGWGDLILAYRHLEWDMGDDGLLEDFSFSGPAAGVKFNF